MNNFPKIILGTMTWGAQNTEQQAHEQLDYAVKTRGVDWLDTAEIYPIPPEKHLSGLTETYIGNWLKANNTRDKVKIATKIGIGDIIGHRKATGYDADNIKRAIEGSLKRLQTDHIDLYQIHWPDRDTNFFGKRGYSGNKSDASTKIEATLVALKDLMDQGVIGQIGISNETPWGVSEYLRLAKEKDLPKIATIQNTYSLTNRTYEIGLAEMCHREGVEMLAYSVLAMGVLTGKYLNGAQPEGARFTLSDRNRERYDPAIAQDAVAAYVDLARANSLDPAQMALSFALSKPFILSVIIGASTMDQLKVAIDSADLILSEKVLSAIENIHLQYPDPSA
jgi:aryl-alcohol dehydrogenase-like predicted oxidoreductase